MNCRGLLLSLLGVAIFACSSDDPSPAAPPGPATCEGLADFRFEHGADDGHADPLGAKAARQARAGKIKDAAQIVQGPLAKHKARVGDYLLANERIALYIEAEGRRSGYAPFGGEILAIDPVGADGRPVGLSEYGETLIMFSRQGVRPDRVSVIADGSDGKAAVIRSSGVLGNLPFMDALRALSPEEYGYPVALDYVLEPGAEKVLIRLHIANSSGEPVDFGKRQNVAFFHSSRSKVFTESTGFAGPKGDNDWIAFDGGASGFLVRSAAGRISTDIDIAGFRLFNMSGLRTDACEKKTVDYIELVPGGPGIDGTLEAKRRAYAEPAWREVRGVVKEEGASALAGAWVHAIASDGKYLTRALTNAAGEFVLHVPPGPVSLTPTLQGWAIPAPAVVDGPTADLTLPRRGAIAVTATDAASGVALPVRVQVIPTVKPVRAPESFGLREEERDRLWQDFAITGVSTLPVPPGEHRVVVSRGYEYELLDAPVTVAAGATVPVEAKLRHSVDTAGVMCADFHVHSFYSPDSSDPVEDKVKAAVADGLDIPVSSEHEWIVDFQPTIARLGLTRWAFGVPSEELTTFAWGHFGVLPLYPKPDQPNNGAVDWVGQKPPAFFHQVAELPEKPVFIVNHPSSRAGVSSYFIAASLDRAKGSGDAELWSDEFSAIEVFNQSSGNGNLDENRDASVADWFALLNAGKTYWATGSSDSHDERRSFVGYPRTCLRFGHDDPTQLTPEKVRDALRVGAATISGGLYMTVEAPGGMGPGATSTPGAYKVVVQSPSWFSATELEVIVDGTTTETLPLVSLPGTEPGKRYEAAVNVAAAQSKARHWVVFHARGAGDLSPVHPEKKPFAVSNPIFF